MVVEAKQAARSYLDAIATRIMRSQVSHPTTAGRPVRRDAEVVFIAPIEGGRLIAPWDRRPQPGGDSSAEWSTLVQKAEFQEFNRSNAPEAERLWHAAIEHARLPDLEAYARLGLARTLRKEGRSREAAAHYRNLLRLPVDVSDEHGVPFFLSGPPGLRWRRLLPPVGGASHVATRRHECSLPDRFGD
jgi:hypothetical protein